MKLYSFVSNGTCESNGMKSIYNAIECKEAATHSNKTSKNVIIREEIYGNGRPTGCSWHAGVKYLELWKHSNGACNVHGYAGCFCKKISSKS